MDLGWRLDPLVFIIWKGSENRSSSVKNIYFIEKVINWMRFLDKKGKITSIVSRIFKNRRVMVILIPKGAQFSEMPELLTLLSCRILKRMVCMINHKH